MRLYIKSNSGFGIVFQTVIIILLATGCAVSEPETERPNLLFVFADQFRKQAVGFMNEDQAITPNLDRLAEEGFAFTNAISSCPICSPYRAMLMTGRFPMSTGMTSNCMPGSDLEMKDEEFTIGDILKENGYSTGYIGKWHLEVPSLNRSERPIDGATDPWDGWTPQGVRRHGFEFWYAYNCNGKHFDPNYWKDTPERIDMKLWSVAHETDIAIDFIKNRPPDQPFAIFLAWNPPHNPYVAPDQYMAMYDTIDLSERANVKSTELSRKRYRSYLAAVSSCDDNFGRLMSFLDQEGLSENTIVIFTSDHGEMMGSHGRYAKSVWFDESIGIPFIVRWGKKIKPAVERMPFACYHFMPTILGLMGIEIPLQVEGTDYSKLITGGKQEKATSAVIAGYGNPAKILAVGQPPSIWALKADSMHRSGIDWQLVGYRGLRTERYTYVVDRGWKNEYLKRYLYDNLEDPFQTDPVIADQAGETNIMMELEAELQSWLLTMHDPFNLR